MNYAGLELTSRGDRCYFELPELAKTHDRKGPNVLKQDAFIARHGLKKSTSKKHPSWAALLPPELSALMRVPRTNRFTPVGDWLCMERAHDHHKLYVRKGSYVYTTQPYGLDLGTYQAIEAVWTRHGFYVDISYVDAWHWPGETPLLVISQTPMQLTK